MISKLMQLDRKDLVKLCQKMTPQERLEAFVHQSSLAAQMAQAGLSKKVKKVKKL